MSHLRGSFTENCFLNLDPVLCHLAFVGEAERPAGQEETGEEEPGGVCLPPRRDKLLVANVKRPLFLVFNMKVVVY